MERKYQHQEEGFYTPGEKRELELAKQEGILLAPYVEENYDTDQLDGIRYAMELGVEIGPYLNREYRGSCIKEIAIGLKEGLDVSIYADLRYTWRKMREIRLGMEQHLDITKYLDPLYSYWQMREIRLGLKANLDVSFYSSFMYTPKEMRKRRLILNNRKNFPELSYNWKIINEHDYDLCISPDGMRAYLKWHGNRAVESVEELERILQRNSIVFGISHEALEKVSREYQSSFKRTENEPYTLVARGKAPKDGKDGYYEWKFRVGKKQKMNLNEDGTLDFDNMHWFDSVKKGQVLAVYHFAEAASDGRTVFGKKLIAKLGREKETLNGKGFELLSDLKTYVAGVDGHVFLKKGNMIVEDMMALDQVQSSSQFLCYDGDMYVRGNIEGPVTIKVSGDLVVDGFTQNARIQCGGNLILKGGINNALEPAKVEVQGCVLSPFFEYTSLHADGNIYFGKSLQSNLSAYGAIVSYGKKGGIIGGTSYSEKGFCLTSLGNEVGVETELSIGGNENIHTLRLNMGNKAKKIKMELAQLLNARNQINDGQNAMQKNIEEFFHRMENTIAEKNRQLSDITRQMENLKRREERAKRSKIVVEHQIYENVKIHYLNHKIMAIPSSQVEIRIHKDGLVMEKMFHAPLTEYQAG